MPSTWVLVGASRGIGLEFVRQLLARGDQVIAAVRNEQTANQLWQLAATQPRPASCLIERCDVTSEDSIDVRLCASVQGPCLTVAAASKPSAGILTSPGIRWAHQELDTEGYEDR